MYMRQREKVQEMLRCLILALCAGSLSAAILPDNFSGFSRLEVSPVALEDRPIWDEFGLEAAERGDYTAGERKVAVTAYRMKDPTGAFAAFQWQRPANANSGHTAATVPGGKLVIHANYLLSFAGSVSPAEQNELQTKLPGIVNSSLPPLPRYLPVKGRVANSERYVLGPASLAKFEPRISSELASFSRGAELQIARYRTRTGEAQLAIASYPTPQMAIERLRAFEALPEASVARSGPMVLVALPKTPETHALVQSVSYQPKLTWTEHVSKDTPQDAAKMILAICVLAGVLIAASVVLGMIFGGVRFAVGRFGIETADHSLTTLKIDSK
jgi:hypothetical protein